MVMILSGSYPPLAEQNLSYASYEEADLLRVDMKTPSGPSANDLDGEKRKNSKAGPP